MRTEPLLDCPFCGKSVEIKKNGQYECFPSSMIFIKCCDILKTEDTEGLSQNGRTISIEKAAVKALSKRWNTRAPVKLGNDTALLHNLKFKVLRQGDVRLMSDAGYMLVGDGDAVCFHIDATRRAFITSSTSSKRGCPVIFLETESGDHEETEIEFIGFRGWRFHSGGGGKSISIALVRDRS